MPVFLIDIGCFRPPNDLHVDMDEMERQDVFRKTFARAGASAEDIESNVELQRRVFERSGMSRKLTNWPRSLHPLHCGDAPKTDLDSAAEECMMATGGAVSDLLSKTGLKPSDIDILVTNCSVYNPTPSMASMVVHKFKMRSDIQSYHLGGMGCSSGVIAVNLIRDLLVANPGSNALLVTTETLTPAFYKGVDKHRLITNILYRMGAAAILMSNKSSWGSRAKCISFGPDDKGVVGLYLGTDVVQEATKALEQAMCRIGPYALSWRQLGKLAVNYVQRHLGLKVSPYIPIFSDGIQKFLIYAGGGKLLDGIGAALRLEECHLAPSRAVLHDYGNLSSSSTWYTLTFVESCQGVKRGDRILQIGAGSGLKCGVNIWKALRNIDAAHEVWRHRLQPAPQETGGLLAWTNAAARLLRVRVATTCNTTATWWRPTAFLEPEEIV